ncbi:MAG: sigma-70 family RNA polymerase sigma factor [Acidobacteriota bacterium]
MTADPSELSGAQLEITGLLLRWRSGDEEAFEALLPLVYEKLRALARTQLRSERQNHTLQATALVHEAYVRLLGDQTPDWQGRAHFYAVASVVMRRVLIEHARALNRQRRGGGAVQVELQDDLLFTDPAATAELVALDDALGRLEEHDLRKARVVQLRFFGGLTLDEVSEVLRVAPVTVVRDWRMARAWLLKELGATA